MPRRRRFRDARLAIAAAVLLAGVGALAGCVRTRVIHSSWDNLPADPKPQAGQRTVANPTGSRSWAIQLARITGSHRAAKAYDLVRQARSEAGMADLWVQDTPKSSTLYRGHFANPNGSRAQALVRGAKHVRLHGKRPFKNAQLVPIATGRHATTDPLDLRQYANTGSYSLQVGFYDKDYKGGDFRAAAEKRARQLRAKGYQAFYYHGPHRSLVTIGVFTRADFVLKGKVEGYGPRIKDLQEKFPHNRGNGHVLYDIINGKNTGKQPSFLVRVY